MKPNLVVQFEGPFFKRDPMKTMRQNIRKMLDALARWGEAEVQDIVAANAGGMPYYTGWTWAHTKGYTTSPKTGKRWALHAAIGVPTTGMSARDAIRTKAAAKSIEERWHPYRKVKSAVYRARPLITANLTEGLE